MEYKYKTRFCPLLETESIRFPKVDYGLPLCSVCPTTGVPVPSNILVSPGNRFATIIFNFNFRMNGEDHFLITILDANENIVVFTLRFQPSNTYVIPSLVNGTPYYAIIVPVINGIQYRPGISSVFVPSSITIPPTPPTNLAVNMSNVQATITFSSAIGNIDYYQVQTQFGSNVVVPSSPAIFNGLTSGIQYTFTAFSWRTGISSSTVSIGPVFAGPPGAPSNLLSTPSYSQIRLDWSQGSGVTPNYYEVSNVTTGFNVSVASTTYTQTSLSNNTSYSYRIRGFGNQVFGPSANIVASTLSPPVPNIWYPDAGSNSFATIGTCVASDKNSNWVAGGGSGAVTLLFSSNGSNWSNAINGFTTFARGVATDTFGRWIATGQDTGGNTIKYSTDNGSNWTDSIAGMFTSGENGWCVATDKLGRWFVGGTSSGSTIRYSTNGGSNWSNVTSGWFVGACRGIATNGTGTWVAVGNNLNGKSIKYSTDNGLNWSDSPTVLTFNDTGLGIAYKNGVWIATGRHTLSPGRTILYSTDGITWSPTIGDFTNIGFAVAVDNNGVWVAGGSDSSPGNTIKYSFNGINWSNVSLGSFTGSCLGVDVNNAGLWVGAGSNPTTLRYSIAT